MKLKLFDRIKELAKSEVTENDRYDFITEALALGLAKLDNPIACSGQIIWKDGSPIKFNEAFKLDRDAMERLALSRVKCNNELANHPTITVYSPHPDMQCEVGLLGKLNGLFGTDEYRIAWSTSSLTGESLGFVKSKVT